MSNEFSGNLSDFRPAYHPTHRAPTLEEVSTAMNVLVRFYDYAPFAWGEIEHTVNALDEYRHRISSE